MQAASATAQFLEEPHVNVSFSLQGRQLPADHGYLLYSAISRITSNAGYAGVPPARSPLHKTDWLAVELISGFPAGQGLIALPHNGATLRLRIPAENYRNVLPLAGKRLNIGGHQIRLGLPVARPLEAAPSLYARVVTIKKFTEAEPFLEAVKRKLDQFGIKGRVELPLSEPPALAGGHNAVTNSKPETTGQYHLRQRVGQSKESREAVNSDLEATGPYHLRQRVGDAVPRFRRRIVTIHGKSVVGFSVAVHDLNDEDSLLLQAGAVKVVSSEDGSVKWQSIFSRRAMGCGFFNPIAAEQEK